MKKEWFEPGPDGVIPFEREYLNANVTMHSAAIAAAFRALLSAEVQEPPALQVGDVVRLERYESNPNGLSWFESEAHLIGTEKEITHIYADGTAWLSVGTSWPRSALTLVRRAGEVDGKQEENRNGLKWFDVHLLHAQLHARNDEIVGLRAEVERWKSIADAHEQNYNMMLKRIDEVAAERDALRARIDDEREAWQDASGMVTISSDGIEQDPSGVTPAMLEKYMGELHYKASMYDASQTELGHGPVGKLALAQDGTVPSQIRNLIREYKHLEGLYEALRARIDGGRIVVTTDNCWWTFNANHNGAHTQALLIDIAPISDAGDVADERVGKEDRREIGYTEGFASMKWLDRPDAGRHGIVGCTGDVIHARSNDRRRTPGTIADRDERRGEETLYERDGVMCFEWKSTTGRHRLISGKCRRTNPAGTRAMRGQA